MSKANADIREAAKKAGVYLYNIADRLGVCENTLTIRLRRELSEDNKRQILDIISELAAEQRTETSAK